MNSSGMAEQSQDEIQKQALACRDESLSRKPLKKSLRLTRQEKFALANTSLTYWGNYFGRASKPLVDYAANNSLLKNLQKYRGFGQQLHVGVAPLIAALPRGENGSYLRLQLVRGVNAYTFLTALRVDRGDVQAIAKITDDAMRNALTIISVSNSMSEGEIVTIDELKVKMNKATDLVSSLRFREHFDYRIVTLMDQRFFWEADRSTINPVHNVFGKDGKTRDIIHVDPYIIPGRNGPGARPNFIDSSTFLHGIHSKRLKRMLNNSHNPLSVAPRLARALAFSNAYLAEYGYSPVCGTRNKIIYIEDLYEHSVDLESKLIEMQMDTDPTIAVVRVLRETAHALRTKTKPNDRLPKKVK